jgi:hypothetical protein
VANSGLERMGWAGQNSLEERLTKKIWMYIPGLGFSIIIKLQSGYIFLVLHGHPQKITKIRKSDILANQALHMVWGILGGSIWGNPQNRVKPEPHRNPKATSALSAIIQ